MAAGCLRGWYGRRASEPWPACEVARDARASNGQRGSFSRLGSGKRAMMSVTPEPQLTADHLRQAAYEWGLTPSEYERVLEGLGRQPTLTEIAMFSVEWC